MLNLFSRLLGAKAKIYKRPTNVCLHALDLSHALVSELSGVPFEKIQVGKLYATNELGAMCFLDVFKRDDRWIVGIYGRYKKIENWVFEDSTLEKELLYDPIVQIDCSVFVDEEEHLLAEYRTKEICELGILYIDPLGFARRMRLEKEIHLNKLPTPENLVNTGNDYYVCSWVEVANVAFEHDYEKKWKAFINLVKLYCKTLDTGIRQCGFMPSKTMITIGMKRSENKVNIDFTELRSANPPSEIPEPIIVTDGLSPVDVAIKTIEANLKAVEEALSFESDKTLRNIILLNVMRYLISEWESQTNKSEDKSLELFGEIGIIMRKYYNCGKKIMKLVDQIIIREMEAECAFFKQGATPKMRQFIKSNVNSSSPVLSEFCKMMVLCCGS